MAGRHARRAQLEVQSAQPEYRDDLELLTGFYADYSLYDFEYDELRRRILGLPMRVRGSEAEGARRRGRAGLRLTSPVRSSALALCRGWTRSLELAPSCQFEGLTGRQVSLESRSHRSRYRVP